MQKSEILSKTSSVHHAPKTYLRVRRHFFAPPPFDANFIYVHATFQGSGNRYYKAGMVVAMGCGLIFAAFTPNLMLGKGRYE